MQRPFRAIFLALVIAFGSSAQAEKAPGIPLVEGGKPAVYLELGGSAEDRIHAAVEDLVEVLYRVSGARIPLAPTEGLLPLYVGVSGDFPGLPAGVPELEGEAFYFRTDATGICLIGASPLAAQHAVYTLLRDIGCRWVMPGDIGECLPRTKDILLPVQQRVEAPDFRYRDIWYAYGSSPEAGARHGEWLRRNRMYRPPIQHGHNLTQTLGMLAPYEERPELYGLLDGERQKAQICTSNPETVALVAEAIAQYLEKNPQTIAYSLCPDDNSDFCQCHSCTALDSGYIDSGGKPSIADRYQVFLNQVFDGLKDRYPNVLLTTYSYNENHTDPPVKTQVHPNTCIFATTSVFCSMHGIGDHFCSSRQAFKALLESWTSKTKHVFIYEYDPVPYSGGLPWPMWESHGLEMASYKDIGVAGVSFEGQNSWAPYFPNYYLGAQMMWDAGQEATTVFGDMLNAFFLESASEMAAYYEGLAAPFRGVERKGEWGLSDYPKYFPGETLKACGHALEQAEAKATSALVKQRLEMVRLSFEEMDAYLALRNADDTTSYATYKGNLNRLSGAIDRMAALNEDFLLADIAREKTSAGISGRFAVEQGFINRWLLCGPFDNTGMDGHDHPYPPEAAVELQAAYRGKNGTEAAWRPNHTPEWQGYVDLAREFDQTDWVCAYAYCQVTLERGPKDVLFRIGSNDSVKAFLNGAEIWSNKISRPAGVDDDLVPVRLPEGTSSVLLKIGQTGKDWGFFFRITEPDSDAVPDGLRVKDAPLE